MNGSTQTSLPVVVQPSGLVLSATGPSRQPPRPPDRREPGYLEAFDSHTLLYDVFRTGDQVLAVAPPALNLGRAVTRAGWRTPDGRGVRVRRERGLDRFQRYWFRRVPVDAEALVADIAGERAEVRIGADLSERFRGRRALMTLQLDNELEWISDWIRWHVRNHGTDAVLVYDNGSTRYALDELAETIASVPGVSAAAVVDWAAYPYGPIGRPPWHLWDSNYAQHGALEDARWRFLRTAAGMLSVDVDELVESRDGVDVYTHAAAARGGLVRFEGVWLNAVREDLGDRVPRHSDCVWVDPTDSPAASKWCAVPALIPRGAQASVHHVAGAQPAQPEALRFRHCRPIATRWQDPTRDARDEVRPGWWHDDEFAAKLAATYDDLSPSPVGRPQRHDAHGAGLVERAHGWLRFQTRRAVLATWRLGSRTGLREWLVRSRNRTHRARSPLR